ncbi:hypothetical protein J1N35_017417 [Gossypium stocksii]|uniref:Transmembrane protein n=1 Tax=Gossypium stocksii TaxID=47602 RepID=A0A9D4A646_9ROSI|nr:hypothetical protein J1N35_017417 [Gossypium stocksii]
MDKFQGFVLLFLLVISVSSSQVPMVSAARPFSILPDQQSKSLPACLFLLSFTLLFQFQLTYSGVVVYIGYSKIFATLGVVCKCCDGSGGECSTTWTQPCSKLKCLPWKLH